MKISFDNGRKSEEGFIYVASRDRLYYELALYSAQTLKDYHPDSHVTLFTHENFVDKRAEIFDTVITEIPIHYRAKMWCMARTPYQKTIYTDVDSYIKHRDIRKMHSFLDDCDMFFTPITSYTVANKDYRYIDRAYTIEPPYHGAVCGYKKTDLTVDFMQTWFDKYLEQLTTTWKYGKEHYSFWQIFDMFTLWRMTSGKFPEEFKRFDDVKIKLIENRFNCTGQHLPTDIKGGPAVLVQVDKHTWEDIPSVKKILDKGRNDETHSVEKRSLRDPTYDFN